MSVNAFDFLLDMALGYVDVELDESNEQKPNIDFTSVLDIEETNKILKTCSIKHASFNKLLKKRKNNVKKDEMSTEIAKISKSSLICGSVRNSFSKILNFFIPEAQRQRQRDFFRIVEDFNNSKLKDSDTVENETNNIIYEIKNQQIMEAKELMCPNNLLKDKVEINNEKNKILNENLPKRTAEDLQLFLNYISAATKEFNDEEIMEFEIKMLKVIRNIKGKRELKQNIKKYCSAINFGDSSIF